MEFEHFEKKIQSLNESADCSVLIGKILSPTLPTYHAEILMPLIVFSEKIK